MNRDDSRLEDWRLNPPDVPELEKCPFCGRSPEPNYDYGYWRVGCGNPNCYLYLADWTTVEIWNRRSEK